MALIKCPECKKKVSDQCENCPNCGYPIKANIEKVNTEVPKATTTTEVVNGTEKKSERVKRPINKKALIAIIAVASVVLIVGGIIGYNALLPRINATRDFKAVVVTVEEKNAQLDAAIKESEDLILKKQPLLDESLIPALEMAISDTKAVKELNFEIPGSVEEIISRTEELKKVDYTERIEALRKKHEAVVVNAKRYQLVNNPTEAYIIQCLQTIPEIINISAVTEDNDPNGQLNKPGGYTATVYFAHEIINLDKSIYGETLIEQGTDAGGGIEVYTCVEDAVERRDYLATFDGGIFANGTHTVIGTVLVRTSNELTATQQKDLEAKLIAALTFLPEIDINNSESNKTDDSISAPTTTPNTTPPTLDSTKTENKKDSNSSVTVTPDDRKQAAVAEAIKQANRLFPSDRHFIEYILVNPSLEEGFEAYTEEEAAYAIANANIDWKKHALQEAKELIKANPDYSFSQVDIHDSVDSSGGYCSCTGFTSDEIQYAIDNCGIDWKEKAIEAAITFRQNNQDRILSVYELCDYLSSLGYSDAVCEDVSFYNTPEGFDDGSAMYDYERIIKFSNQGYSRDAIVNYYLDMCSYEDATYLVDECLAGRKLTYEYVDGSLELVEH